MIRTPYPELQRDETQLRALFATWNAEVQASIDEYWLHPRACCPHGGACPSRAYRRRMLAARR